MNSSETNCITLGEKLIKIVNDLSEQDIISVYRMFNCIIFALETNLKKETDCIEFKERELLMHIFENAKLIYVKTLYRNDKLESILVNNGQPQ